MVNQWVNNDRTFAWWSSTFKDALVKFGHTMLVLSPWDAPVPLTRAWCLWEIFCSHEAEGVELEVVLSDRDRAAFVDAVGDDLLWRGAQRVQHD